MLLHKFQQVVNLLMKIRLQDACHTRHQSYLEGHQDGKEEHRRQHLEDMDVAVQASYERGLIEGRAIAAEDVRMLREQKSILEKKIRELTEQLKDNKSKL